MALFRIENWKAKIFTGEALQALLSIVFWFRAAAEKVVEQQNKEKHKFTHNCLFG